MASLTVSPSDPPREQRHGLCPACRSVRVQIRSRVDVEYEVEAANVPVELVVVDEKLAEAGWEDADEASCPSCGWRGLVSELAV
ncbi:MAG TPA: hypothetical protein VF202_01945 [Trueperaceae bacterium]|jgi:DNA-directed RNA polymerase subunit RPC12/RpoP